MNLVVLCDFDGTITRIDTAEFVLAKFAQGDWEVFSEQFEHGKITLEECLRKQFSLVTASQKEILNQLKSVVTFRPSFKTLAEYCRKHLIPLVIVSAGLDFIIEYFLELNCWRKLVQIYTAKTRCNAGGIKFNFPPLLDKTSANFKQDLVRYYKNQGRKVVYIGNSSGDYAAAKEADYPIAIKGSGLARLCKSRGILCETVRDFQEVAEAIRKVMT